MKKAFDWLDEQGIEYTFHDYKKSGISSKKIEQWLKQASLAELINSKGQTYKKLSDAEKAAATSKQTAIQLMMEYTSMIKRPIVESGNTLLIGFDADKWLNQLK